MPTLADYPRENLRFGPSPIQRLDRLTKHLGGAQVWAKREDVNSGLAFGGKELGVKDPCGGAGHDPLLFGGVELRPAAQGKHVECAHAVLPPSTTMADPVMYEASSDARKAMTAAISSGCATRPIGIPLLMVASVSGSSRYAMVMGVWT